MHNALKEKKEKTVEILINKKAENIKVIDIGELSVVADYFIIATGTSTTHVQSLSENLEELLAVEGYKIHHKEGYRSGRWILMDYNDIVIHLFSKEEREFYNLERLWADANTTNIDL
ncbi:MAG: ribosome silencing factor [Clostridiales bacterium]|nr:ribosome silencing factor [Clostridiales bacterium]